MNPNLALISLVQRRLSPGLRSLFMIGSCLAEETRKRDSIPDLFALVDDVDSSLDRMDAGLVARRVSPLLPPTTVSLCAAEREPAMAKLNLVEPAVVARSIQLLPDLYLAGRFSKRSAILYARDEACRRELLALIDSAAVAIAATALLAPPRRFSLSAAVRHCFELSYMAEIRPETPSTLRARFDAFAPFYFERFAPLLEARAAAVGLELTDGTFLDERPPAARGAESAALTRLLLRSRLRSVARWPKQALVYRGWAPYIAAKIRRSRAA